MTLVYQCDRCKRIFDEAVDSEKEVRFVHDLSIDCSYLTYSTRQDCDENVRLNLCENCLKEFYTWAGFVNTEKIERDKWREQMEEDKKAVQNSMKKKKLF